MFRDDAVYDDGGAARAPGSSEFRVPDGFDPFEDIEVVDEFGLPILPPEHTEAELARILATCPMDSPVDGPEIIDRPRIADDVARWQRIGPDGVSDGVPVEQLDPVDLLLEEVARLAPEAGAAPPRRGAPPPGHWA
jgi:hypothetical protein